MGKRNGAISFFFCVCLLEKHLYGLLKEIKEDSYIWMRCYIYPFSEIRGIGVSKIMKTRQINVSVWYVSWMMKYSTVNTFLKHSA